MRYVVAYDIRNNKRRTKLFKLFESYGAWKQYSVFELELDEVRHVKLIHEIKNIIDSEDNVRIYSLCNRCVSKIEQFGVEDPGVVSNVV